MTSRSTRTIIAGEIGVPGDKSITHRALMLAAAAAGESRLSGLLTGADCQSTAAVLRALGAELPPIPADGGEMRIRSAGLAAWHAPAETLDCGNSGTTARLLLGLLAGRPFCASLTGDGSLCSRPMRRITEPLSRMGARVRELGQPDRLPLELCGGSLRPLHYASPKASAQIKSAVLLAGLSGGVEASVVEPTMSRDHTERMLRSLGVVVTAGEAEGGWKVTLTPPQGPLPGLDVRVPGDPSSAAFLAALALLCDAGELTLRGVGVNPTRTGFFRAVERMGGRIAVQNERLEAGEPVADLVAGPARLRGITVEAEEIPAMVDEVPILAVLAARAEGETRITGAGELRAKESDRISALVQNLRAVGVSVEELPDGMVVQGTDAPLAGAVRAFHDHRIAMAFAVLGAVGGNRIEVDDMGVAGVSYPDFAGTLRSVLGRAA